MVTLKGGAASIAMSKKVGKVIKPFPPEVRVTRRERDSMLDEFKRRINLGKKRNSKEETPTVKSTSGQFDALDLRALALLMDVAAAKGLPSDLRMREFALALAIEEAKGTH